MTVTEPATPAELARYYHLRWKILRAPWEQPPGSERDTLDNNSIHAMAVANTRIPLGVGRLHFNTISEAQIRYMAVATRYQRMGIGSLVLEFLEHRARSLGAARIVLEARETAIGFYRKMGYTPTGPGVMLFNRIAHVTMSKRTA